MTKEEFENLTVKEIVKVCRNTISCRDCPFTKTNNLWLCLFIDEPQDWVYCYMVKQNKAG